ncbi:small-conductance mechanosensitive channel [Thioflavicoccus mobilis 8321]|uniref:Small-conductance mechanosensitive channel n=1 Tax=Thioflavicoccus mobilis 8321 TaxID=765912 RepID=L0GZC7_9GAMM|nr:DUF349 domain-containing protein [Thioflavicoccus mobilis]AGA90730.1 small-conductance mechanosensitive channel [Thioflavicoccus mobilis 8321]
MIFKRFLKKKPIGGPGEEDQALLSRTARESDDVTARRDACRRLMALRELREIAASDPDPGVRDIAQARLRNLVCGTEEPGLPLAERLHEVAVANDPRLLEAIATTANEGEVRRSAIDRIGTPSVLTACALRDPLASNRRAAIERLADKAALEQITRQIGKKDKRVYRLAREKLRAIAEQESLPLKIRSQCSELCERVERLGRHGNWEQDRGLLDCIERDWAPLQPRADDELRTRYEVARERFLADYAAYRESQAELLAEAHRQDARRTLLHALLAELAAASESDDDATLKALRERALRIREDDTVTLPEAEKAELDRRLGQSLTDLARHQERLADRRRRQGRARTLHTKITERLAQTQPLDLAKTQPLLKEAQTLLGEEILAAEQARALRDDLAGLEQRIEKQRHHAEHRLAEVPNKIESLTEALTDGELKRAEPLLQSLQAAIDLAQASNLPSTAYAEAQHQIQQAAPRVKELQGWRRWGAEQQRAALCQDIDALLASDAPPETLAPRLREIQRSWKALDQGGSPADQRRWQRFHTAAEQVYERCRPYLEQQATEREANRQARERLCEDLERFLAQVDWERMDWKKAVKAAREMHRNWAAIGPVEGRHRKGLERRFRNAIKQLDQRLDAERKRNRRFREELIAEVAALVEHSDLDRAIEATKECQRRWHTTVAGRKADENALWQRFRDACDAVFGRRRAQLEARDAELNDNLAVRTAICDEAQTLAEADAPPAQIETLLRELDGRWRESAPLPVPRGAAHDLDRRWRAARQGILERLRVQRDAERRASLDLLARQAELCTRLEQALITEDSATLDLTAIKTKWSALPRQTEETLQTAIGARFATALALLERGDPIPDEVLDENHQEREVLCLQLEILAKVDSPAELADERLAFQVSRLTERMAAGEKDPLANAAGLLSKWYLCGPFPAAPQLEERFAGARDALASSERREEVEAA